MEVNSMKPTDVLPYLPVGYVDPSLTRGQLIERGLTPDPARVALRALALRAYFEQNT
jgi:hypothetical protein